MNISRVVGAVILFLGVVGILYPVSGPSQNHDIALSVVGVIVTAFGFLVITSDLVSKRLGARRLGSAISTSGWCLVAAGGVFFVVGGQQVAVMCSCPLGGCVCGDPILQRMFAEGLLVAIAGALIAVSGIAVERELQAVPPSPIQRGRFRGRGMAVLAIALTALLMFSVLDYYPGNYVSDVFESTQFIGGMPDPHQVIISSPALQPAGWHPIGSIITYSLTFDSVPSFPSYRISTLSLGDGFTIASMNATIPLVVSPANPSVTITLSMRGPVYPFYGSAPIFLTIQKINQTSP